MPEMIRKPVEPVEPVKAEGAGDSGATGTSSTSATPATSNAPSPSPAATPTPINASNDPAVKPPPDALESREPKEDGKEKEKEVKTFCLFCARLIRDTRINFFFVYLHARTMNYGNLTKLFFVLIERRSTRSKR